jgi:hypothetical protein
LLSLKFWDKKVMFYMTLKILRSFTFFHKVRLKNIFLRFFKDLFIWKEIEKMIEANFISISNSFIYNSKKKFSFPLLSAFLFNFYMLEMDLYLEKFIFQYNLKKNFYKTFQNAENVFYSYKYTLKHFFPLKVEQSLSSVVDIRLLSYVKYKNLSKYFSFNQKFSRIYEKNIYYSRYLDSLILGFISSKAFVYFLKSKLLTFLKTKLHFSIKELKIFNFGGKNTIFLGVCINSVQTLKNFNRLRLNRKYFLQAFGKILNKQNSLYNFLNKSFYYNFKFDFYHLFNDNCFKSSSILKNFCSLTFYSQSLYYIRINSVFFRLQKNLFLSGETLTSFKYLNFNKYNKYVFNFYNLKLQILLQHILKNLSSYLSSSLSPLELKLYNSFLQLKRKALLLYNEYQSVNLFSNTYENENSQFYNAFFNKHIFSKKAIFSPPKKKSLVYNSYFLPSSKNFSSESFKFFIPFKILLNKLKSLGFLHPFKTRPISNVHFLFFEDDFIIRSFGFIAYSFLHWFSLCEDFFRLRFLVELIRESCFLTLCRKHNKSKIWAYSVYSFDLIISKTLNSTKSFFPGHKYIYLRKVKSLNSDYFDFDESFFLEN